MEQLAKTQMLNTNFELDFGSGFGSGCVVTANTLYEALPNQPITVVDCRFSLADSAWGRQQYEISHIPNAHYLDLNQDLSSPVQVHGGRHPLPHPEQLARTLAAIGVQSEPEASWVVVYDDNRLAFAARLWWLLRYLGHDRVLVLAGGFSGWQAAGYSITNQLPSVQPGNFTPRIRSDWTVDRAEVLAQKDLPNVVLIDSREVERYRGEREPIDPVAGHIPGALNYPWQAAITAEGSIAPETAKDHWATLPPGAEIIVYCGSGVTACVNLLSLKMAGRKAKLYPGSWSDWCSYPIVP